MGTQPPLLSANVVQYRNICEKVLVKVVIFTRVVSYHTGRFIGGCLPYRCPRRRVSATGWLRTSNPASPGCRSAAVKNLCDGRGEQL